MNDILIEIINFISNCYIRYTPLLILIIIAVQYFTKNQDGTRELLNIVRWVYVTFAILTVCNLLFSYEDAMRQEAFRLRVMGPYFWAYWTMLFCSSILPLVLIFKKIGRNKYLLLFISIMMNIGWLFERFVIFMSLRHDYLPQL